LVADEVTEYTNLLEDTLIRARPTFEDIKRLADRTGLPYHSPTTVDSGAHDLAREAIRDPQLLERLLNQILVVLPNIDTQTIEELAATKRPGLLRVDAGPHEDEVGNGQQFRSIRDRPGEVEQPPCAPQEASAAALISASRRPGASEQDGGRRTQRTSDPIRAAWIGGWFVLAAAIVGALLTALFTNGFGMIR
jgi:hypothetical protein